MDDPDQLPWMAESNYGAMVDPRRATTGSYRNQKRAQGYLPKLSMIPTRMTRGSPGELPPQSSPHSHMLQPEWVLDDDLEAELHHNQLHDTTLNSKGDDNSENIPSTCCFCYDSILCPFTILHGCTALIAIVTVVLNAMSLSDLTGGIIGIVSRIYYLLFGMVIVFIEIDCKWVLEYFKAMELWAWRGLFYIFVGAVTARSSSEEDLTLANEKLELIFGLLLIFVGMIYFFMGICCVQRMKQERLRVLASYEAVDGTTRMISEESTTCPLFRNIISC